MNDIKGRHWVGWGWSRRFLGGPGPGSGETRKVGGTGSGVGRVGISGGHRPCGVVREVGVGVGGRGQTGTGRVGERYFGLVSVLWEGGVFSSSWGPRDVERCPAPTSFGVATGGPGPGSSDPRRPPHPVSGVVGLASRQTDGLPREQYPWVSERPGQKELFFQINPVRILKYDEKPEAVEPSRFDLVLLSLVFCPSDARPSLGPEARGCQTEVGERVWDRGRGSPP